MQNNITQDDIIFLKMAEKISLFSKDPSTKAGAVLVKNGSVIGQGYNGHPAIIERPEFLSDRELKYTTIIHCEDWAVWDAINNGNIVEGSTLYTHPFMSCVTCSVKMVRAGVSRVVAPESDNPRWVESFKLSKSIFSQAGIIVDLF